MVDVYIFLDNSKLRQFVNQRPGKFQYINAGDRDEIVKSIMENSLQNEIKLDFDLSFKEKFLISYIDLIGKMGLKYNSPYWWVTHTAAKNQFGSPFFSNLYIFWSIINKLEDLQKDLLIINPPDAIIGSLKEYSRANSINLLIFHGNSLINKTKMIIKHASMSLASKIYFIFKIIKRKYIADKYLKNKFNECINHKKDYYVMRSWFYPRSIYPVYRDSFFGILPDYLIKQNKNLIIVAGIWEDYDATTKKIAENEDYFIIPQEFFIKYSDPIRVVFDICSNRIRIREKILFESINISGILNTSLDMEFNEKQILDSYIHCYYMKRLLRTVKVNTFTTTYENYPWEKMCFFSLKKYSPQTHIVGYQHSRLSPADLTMYLSEYEKNIIPIPDKINTTGIITKNFLEEYGNYDKTMVKESCALRTSDILGQTVGRKSTGNILLVLGGLPSRAVDTINFAYKGLKNIEKYNIILRCHPALSLERFRKKLDFDIALWGNLSLSNRNDVKADLQEADMVIYDASTISLEAISMGIPIIHIALNDIISFDPVINCTHLKRIVKEEKDLADAIENIYHLGDDEYIKEQTKAREYVENYLYKVTEDGLAEFIMS